jgi:DNA-directed RNA polymerase subunit E'/Rpb7
MEYVAVFEEKVTLTPKDLRKEIASIDNILEQKLRTRLEGRCSRNGYVLPDGVKIMSRSMGTIERGRFTGNLLFHIQAEGKVLNPPDGTIIEGEVIRKNKMGLYVEYAKAIRIIIPRDINIGNEEFESVEVGEMVEVEIKKSRFQVNDEYILSVGLFKSRSRGVKKNVFAANESVGDDETADERTDVGDDEGDAVPDAVGDEELGDDGVEEYASEPIPGADYIGDEEVGDDNLGDDELPPTEGALNASNDEEEESKGAD